MVIGDCCIDYEVQCLGLEINGTTDLTEIVMTRQAGNLLYQCITHWHMLYSYQKNDSDKRASSLSLTGFHMISGCPDLPYISEHERAMCLAKSNYITRTPVSASDLLIFKNIYCAFCNGYKENLIVWNASYICSHRFIDLKNFTRLDIVNLDRFCHFFILSKPQFVLNSTRLRCKTGLIDRCPSGYPTNSSIKNACDRYAEHKKIKFKQYKNKHCAQCNGVMIRGPNCADSDKSHTIGITPIGNTVVLPQFDILFDLFDKKSTIKGRYVSLDTNGIVSRDKDSLECDEGTILMDGNCTLFNMSSNEYGFTPDTLDECNMKYNILNFVIYPSKRVTKHVSISDYFDDISMLLNVSEIRHKIPNAYFVNRLNLDDPCTDMKSNANFTNFKCVTFAVMSQNGTTTMDILERISGIFRSLNKTSRLTIRIDVMIQNHANCTSFRCNHGKDVVLGVPTTNITQKGGEWYAMIQGYSYLLSKIPSLFSETITVFENRNVSISNRKTWGVFCKSILPNDCTKIFIHNQDYILHMDDSVFLKSQNLTLVNDEFEMWNSGIIICKKYLRSTDNSLRDITKLTVPQRGYGQITLRGVLSILCCCLSLLALLLTFFTYCSLYQLRTLPGKCVMSLTACLFFAQLLFLCNSLGKGIYYLCLVLSVLQHYYWLAAFAWMNVLSFTVCQSFTKFTTIERKAYGLSRFQIYSVLAWLSPLIAISPCLSLHMVGSFGIQYIRPATCWLESGITIILFFAIPVGIILLINTCFFMLAICAIHNSVESAKRAKNRGFSQELRIYSKLSTLMGLTWVFGFLSPFADPLAYIFIVLNGLQGVSIFVAFVLQRAVIYQLKQRLSFKK